MVRTYHLAMVNVAEKVSHAKLVEDLKTAQAQEQLLLVSNAKLEGQKVEEAADEQQQQQQRKALIKDWMDYAARIGHFILTGFHRHRRLVMADDPDDLDFRKYKLHPMEEEEELRPRGRRIRGSQPKADAEFNYRNTHEFNLQ